MNQQEIDDFHDLVQREEQRLRNLGREDEIRTTIEDLLELLAEFPSDARRAEIASMDLSSLQSLRQQLKDRLKRQRLSR